MPFKDVDSILSVDPRMSALVVVRDGRAHPIGLADHHGAIAGIQLSESAPADVRTAFDRARNTLVYAYFDYDLFVVGQVQVFGAFELALKFRLDDHGTARRGTLRNLVDRARKVGIFPPADADGPAADRLEALINIRNSLSHGSVEVHSPGMALEVVDACARAIDEIFPAQLSPSR